MKVKYAFVALMVMCLPLVFLGCHGSDSASSSSSSTTDTTTARRFVTINQMTAASTVPWTEGTEVSVYNNTRRTSNIFDTFTASSTSDTTRFTGYMTCKRYNFLEIFWPKVGSEGITSLASEGGDSLLALDISGQDGTLETINSKFNFTYGKAKISTTTATDLTAKAAMIYVRRLMSIGKFSFVDENGDEIKDITSVKIENMCTEGIFDFTTSKISLTPVRQPIVLKPTSGYLTLPVYVALFAPYATAKFTVTTADGSVYSTTEDVVMSSLTAGTTYPFSYYLKKQ